MTIYVITNKNIRGPGGHGEPGESYFTLARNLKTGEVFPAFESRIAAEEYRKQKDTFNFYEVSPLLLVEL